jgi:hypothetical protein
VADCTLRISDCMERLVSNNQEEMSKVVDDKLNNLKTEMLSTMNTKLDGRCSIVLITITINVVIVIYLMF